MRHVPASRRDAHLVDGEGVVATLAVALNTRREGVRDVPILRLHDDHELYGLLARVELAFELVGLGIVVHALLFPPWRMLQEQTRICTAILALQGSRQAQSPTHLGKRMQP